MQLSTGDPQVPDNLIGNAKYIKGLVDARFVDIGQGASNESFLGSLLRVSTDDRYNTPLGWYDKFWTSPTQSFLECAKLLKNRNCALLSEYFSMQPNQALLGSSEPKLSDEQELSRIKSALYGIHKYVLDKTPVTKLNPEDLSCLTFREEFGSVSERTDCNFVNMGVCLEWNYKTTRTKQLFTKNSCSRSIAISYLCPESGASRYSLSLDAGKEISGNWRDKDPKCLERELRIFGDM